MTWLVAFILFIAILCLGVGLALVLEFDGVDARGRRIGWALLAASAAIFLFVFVAAVR